MKRVPEVFFASMVLAWLAASGPVCAAPSGRDQKLLELMRSRPQAGAVIVEAIITQLGQPAPTLCQSILIDIKSETGATLTRSVQVSPTLFGKASDSSTYGEVMLVEAGVHTIEKIKCERGPAGFALNAPFAKFSLRAGQILNLGRLDVVYQPGDFEWFSRRKFKGDWRVVDLSARAAASLAKRVPEFLAKAKKQHMTAFRAAKP